MRNFKNSATLHTIHTTTPFVYSALSLESNSWQWAESFIATVDPASYIIYFKYKGFKVVCSCKKIKIKKKNSQNKKLPKEVFPRKTSVTFPMAAIKAYRQEFQICTRANFCYAISCYQSQMFHPLTHTVITYYICTHLARDQSYFELFTGKIQ